MSRKVTFIAIFRVVPTRGSPLLPNTEMLSGEWDELVKQLRAAKHDHEDVGKKIKDLSLWQRATPRETTLLKEVAGLSKVRRRRRKPKTDAYVDSKTGKCWCFEFAKPGTKTPHVSSRSCRLCAEGIRRKHTHWLPGTNDHAAVFPKRMKNR